MEVTLEKINKTDGLKLTGVDTKKIDDNAIKIENAFNNVPTIVALTATEYSAITTPDATTLYLIKA